MARPTVMTPETLKLLREAFAIGATDEEAAAYAKIGVSTLYDYQNKDKKFSEEKEALKRQPILKARNTVVKGLDDIRNAQWYLEHKAKDEFSLRQEMTGKDGKDLPTPIYNGKSTE